MEDRSVPRLYGLELLEPAGRGLVPAPGPAAGVPLHHEVAEEGQGLDHHLRGNTETFDISLPSSLPHLLPAAGGHILLSEQPRQQPEAALAQQGVL